MNRIFTILALLAAINSANAQNYYSFPLENSRWSNQHRSYTLDEWFIPTYTTEWVNNFCANGNDTTINTINYKQIDLCNNSSSSYFGALRYNIGQVFFVPQDSTSEFLLYDFSMDAGESVDVIMMNGNAEWPSVDYSMTNVTVQNVDTITVNGTERRRLDMGGAFWIEGIGNTFGLFMEPWMNVSMYFRELVCASENDTIVYDHYSFPQYLEQGMPGTCDLTLALDENSHDNILLSVFPNPTQGVFTISTPTQVGEVTLFDAAGTIQYKSHITTGELKVSSKNLSPGIYLIHFENGENVATKRLVISN
jgi:hypothetical protein